MSIRTIVHFCAAALIAAAWAPAPAAAARLTLKADGVKRTATVILREPLKLRRRPLVIVLHGTNSHASLIRRRLGMEGFSHSTSAIFVYPEAIKGRWAEKPGAAARRDLMFLRDLVARIARNSRVDRRRVFLIGVSSGAAMAIRAACAGNGLPDTGLATVATSLPADLAERCRPRRPIAYLAVENGESAERRPATARKTDEKKRANERWAKPPATKAAEIFARAAHCAARTHPAHFIERRRAGHTRIVVERFAHCQKPVEIIHIGGERHERAASKEFNAGVAIWKFLRKFGA